MRKFSLLIILVGVILLSPAFLDTASARSNSCPYELSNGMCLTEEDLETIYLDLDYKGIKSLYAETTKYLSGSYWINHKGFLYLIRHTIAKNAYFRGAPTCLTIRREIAYAQIARIDCDRVFGIIDTSEKPDLSLHEVVHADIRANSVILLMRDKNMSEAEAKKEAQKIAEWLMSAKSGKYWRLNEVAPIWVQCGAQYYHGFELRPSCQDVLTQMYVSGVMFRGHVPKDLDNIVLRRFLPAVQRNY
jgi:hypothetical protein